MHLRLVNQGHDEAPVRIHAWPDDAVLAHTTVPASGAVDVTQLRQTLVLAGPTEGSFTLRNPPTGVSPTSMALRTAYVRVEWLDDGHSILVPLPYAPQFNTALDDGTVGGITVTPPSLDAPLWKWDSPDVHVRRHWYHGSGTQYVTGTDGPFVKTLTRFIPTTAVDPLYSLAIGIVAWVVFMVALVWGMTTLGVWATRATRWRAHHHAGESRGSRGTHPDAQHARRW
jgi:hypothetical protein